MFWLGPGRSDEQHGEGRLEAAGTGVNDFVFILSGGDQSSTNPAAWHLSTQHLPNTGDSGEHWSVRRTILVRCGTLKFGGQMLRWKVVFVFYEMNMCMWPGVHIGQGGRMPTFRKAIARQSCVYEKMVFFEENLPWLLTALEVETREGWGEESCLRVEV